MHSYFTMQPNVRRSAGIGGDVVLSRSAPVA